MRKRLEADNRFHSYDSINKEGSKVKADGSLYPEREFHCQVCNKHIIHHSETSTGYGVIEGRTYCYDCCGDYDRLVLEQDRQVTLYLCSPNPKAEDVEQRYWRVTNWPGTLSFRARFVNSWVRFSVRVVKVAFEDHRGVTWIGECNDADNSQLCKCKRMAQRKRRQRV